MKRHLAFFAAALLLFSVSACGANSGKVQFAGKWYERSEISAETLEWLEWYNTLPEDQQLMVDFVPYEFWQDGDYTTADAAAE